MTNPDWEELATIAYENVLRTQKKYDELRAQSENTAIALDAVQDELEEAKLTIARLTEENQILNEELKDFLGHA